MPLRIVVALALLLSPAMTLAKEVAGVTLPETITLGSKPLVLNGAGIRSKFFIKVYVGALYLPARARRRGDIATRRAGGDAYAFSTQRGFEGKTG